MRMGRGGSFLSSLFNRANLLRDPNSTFFTSSESGKNKSLGRKLVSVLLISVTGGLALSTLDDLLIYYGCSRKAIEEACKNQTIKDSIGEPIVRGPWYNASLAVAHRRHSVSCTFPVSGPQGTGIFQLKAIRNGDDSWLSFLRPRDWDILIMEALLHVPTNNDNNKTFRVKLFDVPPSQDCGECKVSTFDEQKENK